LYALLELSQKAGNYYFYNNRLEFKPYIGRKKIIFYEQMYVVVQQGDLRSSINISKQDERQWRNKRAAPLRNFKRLCSDINIIVMTKGPITGANWSRSVLRPWKDYTDIPKAIQILRGKAFSFIEK